MTKDPYQILGVLPSASDSEVKSAWRKMIQHAHPDRAQSQGTKAFAHAETQTKILNEAYAEIRRRRERTSPGPVGRTHSSTRETRVEGAPIDTRESIRQASVSVQHAEALVDRWRRHARGVGNALKMGKESHETVKSRGASVRKTAERLAVGLSVIDDSVRLVFHSRLLAPANRAADRAIEAIQFTIELSESPDQTTTQALEMALERAHTCLVSLEETLQIDPEFLVEVIGEGNEAAQSAVDGLIRSLGGMDRAIAEATSACSRCRDARKRALRASRDFNEARDEAASAVDRAMVKSATAHGVSTAELTTAQGAEARFVSERFVEEAARLKKNAQFLDDEQVSSERLMAQLNEQLESLDDWLNDAQAVASELQCHRDTWTHEPEGINQHAQGVIPNLMREVEESARERLEEAQSAFERAQRTIRRAG